MIIEEVGKDLWDSALVTYRAVVVDGPRKRERLFRTDFWPGAQGYFLGLLQMHLDRVDYRTDRVFLDPDNRLLRLEEETMSPEIPVELVEGLILWGSSPATASLPFIIPGSTSITLLPCPHNRFTRSRGFVI